MEKEVKNLPTVQELFSDDIETLYKGEQLNLLLNQEPKKAWIKTHPFIDGHKYIPIDKVEFMLRKIFKRYRIEITGQGTAFNGVWVTVRVHYFSPVTGDMEFHDGIGACQLQTKKGTSPADLSNINNGAVSMAFPIAKTLAIKDACDHFGKLFGCDLNRKDTIPFNADAPPNNEAVPEEVQHSLELATTPTELFKYVEQQDKKLQSNLAFRKLVDERGTELCKGNRAVWLTVKSQMQ